MIFLAKLIGDDSEYGYFLGFPRRFATGLYDRVPYLLKTFLPLPGRFRFPASWVDA